MQPYEIDTNHSILVLHETTVKKTSLSFFFFFFLNRERHISNFLILLSSYQVYGSRLIHGSYNEKQINLPSSSINSVLLREPDAN